MSLIAFISDLHLDAVTGGVKRFDDVSGFLRDTDWSRYDAVVFCGDLCDPDGVDAWASAEEFTEVLGQPQMPFTIAIPGNHDVVEDGRGTTVLHPGSGHPYELFSEPTIDDTLAKRIAYLPYTARAKAYDPALQVMKWADAGERIDLFVGHLNVEGHGVGSETTDMARGREVFWPLDEIAKHYPNALCIGGHYHKGEDILFRDQGPLAKQLLHIVGAPARFTFGEERNTPSYTVLDTDTMGLERVPIPSRQVVTLASIDKTVIRNGAIVRLDIQPAGRDGQEMLAAQQRIEEFWRSLTADLGCTVVTSAMRQISAPVEAVKFDGEAFEDPIAAAKRLAEEWPAAEAEFRAELVGLVETIATEEA